MSVHAFPLDGWDHTSTWGFDVDHYFAQLSPNGYDDSNGPQIWISPPKCIVRTATERMHTIATTLAVPINEVDHAMDLGLASGSG